MLKKYLYDTLKMSYHQTSLSNNTISVHFKYHKYHKTTVGRIKMITIRPQKVGFV